MTFEEAMKICGEVRKRCFRFAMSDSAQKYKYFEDRRLGMMCGVASMAIRVYSKKAFDVYFGSFDEECGHAWNEYGEWRFDVTASQFNDKLPNIYVTRLDGECQRYSYRNANRYNSFRSFQSWPINHRPTVAIVTSILNS